MTKYLSYLMQSGTQRRLQLPPGKGRNVHLNESCNSFFFLEKRSCHHLLPHPRLNGLLCNFSSLLKNRRWSQRICKNSLKDSLAEMPSCPYPGSDIFNRRACCFPDKSALATCVVAHAVLQRNFVKKSLNFPL